jgi:hypothetical protein
VIGNLDFNVVRVAPITPIKNLSVKNK